LLSSKALNFSSKALSCGAAVALLPK